MGNLAAKGNKKWLTNGTKSFQVTYESRKLLETSDWFTGLRSFGSESRYQSSRLKLFQENFWFCARTNMDTNTQKRARRAPFTCSAACSWIRLLLVGLASSFGHWNLQNHARLSLHDVQWQFRWKRRAYAILDCVTRLDELGARCDTRPHVTGHTHTHTDSNWN